MGERLAPALPLLKRVIVLSVMAYSYIT